MEKLMAMTQNTLNHRKWKNLNNDGTCETLVKKVVAGFDTSKHYLLKYNDIFVVLLLALCLRTHRRKSGCLSLIAATLLRNLMNFVQFKIV